MSNIQLPPCSPVVIYKIGLALESGQDEDKMREMWGDETINWLNQAEQDPEYRQWCYDEGWKKLT